VWGNRTLGSLNLSHNGLSDDTLKSFLDALADQEIANEYIPDGFNGLYRLIFLVNDQYPPHYFRSKSRMYQNDLFS
jgi:hypothetical protein